MVRESWVSLRSRVRVGSNSKARKKGPLAVRGCLKGNVRISAFESPMVPKASSRVKV